MNPKMNAVGNERVFRSLSYGLVFLMMTCVIMTLSILIQHLLPEWHTGIFAGVSLFVVLDRLYMHRQLKSLTFLSSEWAIAIGTQWLVILLVLRLLLSYANGLAAFRNDLSLFTRGYLSQFFTAEFVMSFLLALLIWYLTGLFLNLIDEIGLDQELALQEEPVYQTDAVPASQRMVNLVFGMGIALVILAALTRVNVNEIVSSPGAIPGLKFNTMSGGETGALLYFIFGLAWLSLGRLMSLQTHWNRQQIPISSNNMARQWGRYSLAFLLGLAVVVSLLPAGDSIGFFSVLGTVFGFLIAILMFIGQMVIILIALIISIPFYLFDIESPQGIQREPPPMPVFPTQPILPSAESEIWALVRSILLWGSLAVILIFTIRHFVRQHREIAAAVRRSRISNWLIRVWQWLYRSADRTRENLSRLIAESWQSLATRLEGKRLLPRPGLISLGSLDARRRIYFFYLAMVRRGEENGVTRRPAQTPSEYAHTLENALPAETEEIGSITDAFIKARYSRQEIYPGDTDRAKAAWGRIRQALQTKTKHEKSKNK